MDLIQIYTPVVVLSRSFVDLMFRASDLRHRGVRFIKSFGLAYAKALEVQQRIDENNADPRAIQSLPLY
ncbi:hypothetical protein CR513_17908 [Mucuna pruriens]|uniref:Uncharacterized protein n=1 Tax=Mucuna pruriens TaxID=157652 RepID=A0A371H8F7_MUCPR|nr:hypothetical protein CR513_17908 [Mucuna pruriens]